ncbi:MAG TPA: hypothetical protein VIO61_00065 [Anaerolineaceae bacterium]
MPGFNATRPHFELRRVPAKHQEAEGQAGEVEVYELSDLPAIAPALHLKRRDLLTLAGLSSTALFAAACSRQPDARSDPTPTPTITPRPTFTATPPPQHVLTVQASRPAAECLGLNAAGSKIVAAAFSPDGFLFATVEEKDWVRVWNVSTGGLLRKYRQNNDRGTAVAFSPDRSRLASIADDGKTVFIYNLNDTGTNERETIVTNARGSLVFSPDNSLLAFSAAGKMEVWTAASPPKKTYELGAECFAISPDGRHLALAGSTNQVSLHTLSNGNLERPLAQLKSGVKSFFFNADGSYLAVHCQDKSIQIMRVEDGAVLQSIQLTDGDLSVLAFSPDGRTVLTKRLAYFALWSAQSGIMVSMITPYGFIGTAVPSPDLTVMAEIYEKSINLWNFQGTPKKLGVCFFDKDTMPVGSKALTYQETDAAGITRTYALPCGAPIPSGAACTCNCVPGTGLDLPPPCSCVSDTSGGGGFCSCNKICTCIPVRKYCFVMFKPEDRH